IGIFGGTFDPIHLGHLIVAQMAAEKLGLDQVLFIPAGQPPHKGGEKLSPARDRYHMVRLGIKGHRLFKVSDIEIRSKDSSYTVNTLKALKSKYKTAGLFLLLGMDQAVLLSTWKEPQKLFELATVCVLSRPGFSRDQVEARWRKMLRFLPVSQIDISATGIRDRARRAQEIRYLAPEAVVRYIKNKKLYQ
ncbi:MAG: nicotinate-nucleotide adenylyltransferase, partial [bacterium]|nr:nicotinate-nucleotide adenylyltransferase [bacterium]